MRRWVLIATLAMTGCAHQPPPVPEPIERVVLGAYLPGGVQVCLETPHHNSWFDTPVTRNGNPACVSLDALRHWVSQQRAADE